MARLRDCGSVLFADRQEPRADGEIRRTVVLWRRAPYGGTAAFATPKVDSNAFRIAPMMGKERPVGAVQGKRRLGGYCVLDKRFDRGTYRLPEAIPAGAKQVTVRREELVVLLRGLDHAMVRRARAAARSVR